MSIPIPEIVDGIKEQKCVLLLGPGIARCNSGETMQTLLTEYFKNIPIEVKEDLDDLYTCDPTTKTRALRYLQKYCREHSEPNDSHRELALIPCHLYISITPDLLMKQALDGYVVNHEFEYYVSDQRPEEVMKPTRDKPLLYNLFGCVENQDSIIFSQGDLIKYLFSIIKDFSLPQNLRESLKNSDYFIFLGFDFEKWYLKLLLRLIELEESKPSIATEEKKPIATEEEQRFNEMLKSFYNRKYGLVFVDTNIGEFVRNLYEECQNQRLLREIKENVQPSMQTNVQPSIQTEVKELIKQDHIEQALERLIKFMEDEKILNDREEDKKEFLLELYTHSRTFNSNEKKLRQQLITEEAANVDKAKILGALLDIADNF